MQILLPLFAPPRVAVDSWAAVREFGPDAVALVNVEDGPGSGRDPGWTAAIGRLAEAGVGVLGYVDFVLGSRPVREVRAQVRRWAGYPIDGIFFDQVPTSPFLVGAVALAVGTARRAGLRRMVLHQGMVGDPLYRALGAQLGVFDGPGSNLAESADTGTHDGDVYLVHGVPPTEFAAVEALLRSRGAGLALVTDAQPPEVYTTLPSRLDLAALR